jgi:hypothetical protein
MLQIFDWICMIGQKMPTEIREEVQLKRLTHTGKDGKTM